RIFCGALGGSYSHLSSGRLIARVPALSAAHTLISACCFSYRPRYNYSMAVRFIALDIDGTLLDSTSALPEANLRAIEAAYSRGIEVALVTGRRFDFALPIALQIPCPLTMIVNNGALVKSKNGTTHLRPLLPHQIARAVLEFTSEHRAGAAVVFDRPRANQGIYEKIDWGDLPRKAYYARNREFIAQVCPLEDCLTEDPSQVMYSGSVAG